VRAGAERALDLRVEARDVSAAPDQQGRDAVAELDGHVAAVSHGNEHEPRVVSLVNTQTAECDAAHDAPRHDHPDADPETNLYVHTATSERACRQQDDDVVAARFGALGWLGSEGQHRARAGAQQYACRHDLEPFRHHLSVHRSVRRVDSDLFGTVVPHLDRSRPRRRQDQAGG